MLSHIAARCSANHARRRSFFFFFVEDAGSDNIIKPRTLLAGSHELSGHGLEQIADWTRENSRRSVRVLFYGAPWLRRNYRLPIRACVACFIFVVAMSAALWWQERDVVRGWFQ